MKRGLIFGLLVLAGCSALLDTDTLRGGAAAKGGAGGAGAAGGGGEAGVGGELAGDGGTGGDDASPALQAGAGGEENALCVFYRDKDGDGYGDPHTLFASADCRKVQGYVSNSDDCDDSLAESRPAAADESCDGIDQDCSGSDFCQLGCTGKRVNGTSYMFCAKPDLTLEESNDVCARQGMKLARIDDLTENQVVADFLLELQLESTSDWWYTGWIDGTDAQTEGEWRYGDGTLIFAEPSFEAGAALWLENEPDNGSVDGVEQDCLTLWSDGGWSDDACDTFGAPICESR